MNRESFGQEGGYSWDKQWLVLSILRRPHKEHRGFVLCACKVQKRITATVKNICILFFKKELLSCLTVETKTKSFCFLFVLSYLIEVKDYAS